MISGGFFNILAMEKVFLFLLAAVFAAGCSQNGQSMKKNNFDYQGHRGARGLAPENTLPAFQKALELGVSTLELDLAVSKDGELIVSHEPWMSAEICLQPDGEEIAEKQQLTFNIYQMTVEEIQSYDCGSRTHPRFPEQELQKAYKPTLREVVNLAENFAIEKSIDKVFYNIEMKSDPEGDDVFHPTPTEFAGIVAKVVEELGIGDRCIVQSFDLRCLIAMRETQGSLKLALLVENAQELNAAIDKLGFVPEIFSPYFKTLDANIVRQAHGLGLRVIPWTVNQIEDMREMIAIGVDGLISDYPNRFSEL